MARKVKNNILSGIVCNGVAAADCKRRFAAYNLIILGKHIVHTIGIGGAACKLIPGNIPVAVRTIRGLNRNRRFFYNINNLNFAKRIEQGMNLITNGDGINLTHILRVENKRFIGHFGNCFFAVFRINKL